MGLLRKWDERNQRVTDWLAAHPDSGTTVLPHAKSRVARATMVILAGLSMGAALLFGPIALIPGGIAVAVASRRLEHHPARDRDQSDSTPD